MNSDSYEWDIQDLNIGDIKVEEELGFGKVLIETPIKLDGLELESA